MRLSPGLERSPAQRGRANLLLLLLPLDLSALRGPPGPKIAAPRKTLQSSKSVLVAFRQVAESTTLKGRSQMQYWQTQSQSWCSICSIHSATQGRYQRPTAPGGGRPYSHWCSVVVRLLKCFSWHWRGELVSTLRSSMS